MAISNEAHEAYLLNAAAFRSACDRASQAGGAAPTDNYLHRYGDTDHAVILANTLLPDGELGDVGLGVAFPFDRPVGDFLHGRDEKVPLISVEDLFNGPRAVLEVLLTDLLPTRRFDVREAWVQTEVNKVVAAYAADASKDDV